MVAVIFPMARAGTPFARVAHSLPTRRLEASDDALVVATRMTHGSKM
jgi:hypothetical protein